MYISKASLNASLFEASEVLTPKDGDLNLFQPSNPPAGAKVNFLSALVYPLSGKSPETNVDRAPFSMWNPFRFSCSSRTYVFKTVYLYIVDYV